MKHLKFATLLMALLPALQVCHAQEGMTKPILTAAPPAADQSAATTALPDQPVGNGAISPTSYVIGPQDSIVVNVWKDAALSGSLSVRPDGMITLPLLGDIMAAGFTPMGLADDLKTRLKKYINDPLVTVTVTAINSKRIFLLGQIGKTGAMTWSPGLTPLEVIAAAGGLGTFANQRHIYILRPIGNGKIKKIFFDYKKAIKDGNEQGVTLQPGDTLVVP